jgi:hypothetical protein
LIILKNLRERASVVEREVNKTRKTDVFESNHTSKEDAYLQEIFGDEEKPKEKEKAVEKLE